MQSRSVRVALFLIGYMLILLAASVPKGMAPARLADFVWGAVASVALFAFTQLFLKREQRTLRDVGLDLDAGSVSRLIVGVAIGFVVYALTMGIISVALGPVQFSAPTMPSITTWLITVASFMVLSSMEELGFRGYALRSLVPAIGMWPAQVSIAIAFGVSHITFGWSWQAVLMGVIPSALLFGIVAIRSGGLAMPIGVHAALNLAQWAVGEKDSPGIWTLSVDPQHAARMMSTAPFIGMAVTLLAAMFVWRWPSRRLVSSQERS